MSEENNTVVETTKENITEQPITEQPKPNVFDRHPGFKDASIEDVLLDREKVMSEAKSRRLENNELKEKMAEYEKNIELSKQASLEKNEEWKKLYDDLTEKTSSFDELHKFKEDYLTGCKNKVDEVKTGLTKAESELFDLSAKNMSYNDQLVFIEKLVGSRTTLSEIDTSQSITRKPDDVATPKSQMPAFGNSGGVMNLALQSLAKLRK